MEFACILCLPPALIFVFGYFIGQSAFKASPHRKRYSILSGITAVVVAGAIFFAGCLVLLSNATFH